MNGCVAGFPRCPWKRRQQSFSGLLERSEVLPCHESGQCGKSNVPEFHHLGVDTLPGFQPGKENMYSRRVV